MEGVPGWESIFIKPLHESADKKKKELLKLARKGGKRPNQKTHPLGSALCNYASKSSDCYDEDFTKEIKKLAPNWFEKTADNNKKELLKLAKKKKAKKPHHKTLLWAYLIEYTNIKKGKKGSYDADFTKEIKKFAPHWLLTKSDGVIKKKEELLKLARKGGKRPSEKVHPLGKALTHYTSESSGNYDASFAKKIKKLAPHWFVAKSDIANQKKKKLLGLAKKGGKRPNGRTHPLGSALSTYTRKSHKSYDASFTKEIKKLAPYWFVTPSDIANQKKKELLKLARKGGDRPKKTHHLGSVLSNYTSNCTRYNSYDPAFTKQIKKLAPHWFKK